MSVKRIPVRLGDSAFDLIPLIAHDLRTPLTAIKGLSQLALRRPDIPAPAVHYLSTVVDEANQIANLVDDLVLASRIERGEIEVRPSNVDVIALLRIVVDDPANLDEAPRLTLAPSTEPVLAYCDSRILTRAIARLLDVAARQARSSQNIAVGAQRSPAGVELWITACSNVPYSNGTTRRPAFGGTASPNLADDATPNLSVFLAAKLVDAQGGRVLSEDPPGGYAGFHVVLPEARVS